MATKQDKRKLEKKKKRTLIRKKALHSVMLSTIVLAEGGQVAASTVNTPSTVLVSKETPSQVDGEAMFETGLEDGERSEADNAQANEAMSDAVIEDDATVQAAAAEMGVAEAAFAVGEGTEASPFEIAIVDDLRQLAEQAPDSKGKFYVLTANIDMAGVEDWAPIQEFAGHLDGKGFSISNLTVNGGENVGLFATTTADSTLTGLDIRDASVSGASGVGILVGRSSGTIIDCKASGQVAAQTAAGGLVGFQVSGEISLCDVNVTVTGSGISSTQIGGLVGTSMGNIVSSTAYGNVSGYMMVGGLVGVKYGGGIDKCSSMAAVTANGSNIGGLIGYAYPMFGGGTIKNSHSLGAVNAPDSFSTVGGLIGYSSGYSIEACYSHSNINAPQADNVGGLVGDMNGTISRCYAAGMVVGKDNVGGLVGRAIGNISNAYYAGSGGITGVINVGGIVGGASGALSVLHVFAAADVRGRDYVAGIIGGTTGGGGGKTVDDSYFIGNIYGSGTNLGVFTGTQQGFSASKNNYRWDGLTINGNPPSGQGQTGGTGLTEEELQTEATWDGGRTSWDFENTWIWDEANNYPHLGLGGEQNPFPWDRPEVEKELERQYDRTLEFTLDELFEFGEYSPEQFTYELVGADGASIVITDGQLALTVARVGDYQVVARAGGRMWARATIKVTPKVITWSAPGTVNSKTFDGNQTATIASLPTLEDEDWLVEGDDVTLRPGTVKFDQSGAGTGIPVLIDSPWTLSGEQAENYQLEQPTFNAGTINSRALTAADFTVGQGKVNNREYDGTTDATVDEEATLTLDSETITFSYENVQFSDANANVNDETQPIVVNGLTLSVLEAGNFTMLEEELEKLSALLFEDAMISPRQLVWELGSVHNIIYDAEAATPRPAEIKQEPRLVGFIDANEGLVNSEDITWTFDASSLYFVKNEIGSSPIGFTMPDFSENSNYDIKNDFGFDDGEILPKNINWDDVTVVSGTVTKEYDGTTGVAVEQVTQSPVIRINIGSESTLELEVVYDIGQLKFGEANAADTVELAYDGSWTFDGYETMEKPSDEQWESIRNQLFGTGTINPRQISWTTGSVEDKTYDGTTSATLMGAKPQLTRADGQAALIEGDEVEIVAGTASFSDKNVAVDANGVPQAVAVTGNGWGLTGEKAENYQIVGGSEQPTFNSAVITPATLTWDEEAKGKVADKVYDGRADATVATDPKLTSFLNNETFADNFNALTFDGLQFVDAAGEPIADAGTHAVAYESWHVTAGNHNYVIGGEPEFADGEITQLELDWVTVGTNGKVSGKVYDATTDVYGDYIAPTIEIFGKTYSVTVDLEFADKNVGEQEIIVKDGWSIDGFDMSNVVITGAPTFEKAEITPATLTWSGIGFALPKPYDGTTTATLDPNWKSLKLTDFFANDADNIGFKFEELNFADSKVGFHNVYASGTTLTGVGAENYVIEGEPWIVGEITAQVLTLDNFEIEQGTVKTREYDGTTVAEVDAQPTVKLVGVNGADTISVSVNSVAFAEKNAGSQDVIASGIEFSGDIRDQVMISDDLMEKLAALLFAPGTITPKELTWTAGSAESKRYDGTSDVLRYTTPKLEGILNNEITISAFDNIRFSDGVNDTSDRGEWEIRFDGGEATYNETAAEQNYTVTNSPYFGRASITDLTIELSDEALDFELGTREYDGTTDVPVLGTPTVKAFLNGSDEAVEIAINFDDLAYERSDAGEQRLAFSDFTLEIEHGEANYAGADIALVKEQIRAELEKKTGTITPRKVTWSEAAAKDKRYDGTTIAELRTDESYALPTIVRPDGLTGEALIDADNLAVAQGTVAFDTAEVGNDKTMQITSDWSVTDSSGRWSNYELGKFVDGEWQAESNQQPTIHSGAITAREVTQDKLERVLGLVEKAYDGTTALDKEKHETQAPELALRLTAEDLDVTLPEDLMEADGSYVLNVGFDFDTMSLETADVAGTDYTKQVNLTGFELATDFNVVASNGFNSTAIGQELYKGLVRPVTIGTPEEDVISTTVQALTLDKIYDGTVDVQWTSADGHPSLSVMVNGTEVMIPVNADGLAYSDKHAEAGKAITATGISIDNPNFVLTSALTEALGTQLFNGSITPKALTWTAGTANSKLYDGKSDTSYAPENAPALTGIVGTDITVGEFTQLHFLGHDGQATSAVGVNWKIGFEGGALTYAEGVKTTDYTIIGEAGFHPASILSHDFELVEGQDFTLDIAEREYDGTTGVPLKDDALPTVKIRTGGEEVNVPVRLHDLAYLTSDAGEDKAISFSSLSFVGYDALSHEMTDALQAATAGFQEATGKVTPRQVTWSSAQAKDKRYDGTTVAELLIDDTYKAPELVRSDGSAAIVADDEITITAGTVTFDSPAVGTTAEKTMMTNGWSVAGARWANNYTLGNIDNGKWQADNSLQPTIRSGAITARAITEEDLTADKATLELTEGRVRKEYDGTTTLDRTTHEEQNAALTLRLKANDLDVTLPAHLLQEDGTYLLPVDFDFTGMSLATPDVEGTDYSKTVNLTDFTLGQSFALVDSDNFDSTTLGNLLYKGLVTPKTIGTPEEVETDNTLSRATINSVMINKDYDGTTDVPWSETEGTPTVSVQIGESTQVFSVRFDSLAYDTRHAGTKTIIADNAQIDSANVILTDALKAQLTTGLFVGKISPRQVYWTEGQVEDKYYNRRFDATVAVAPELLGLADDAEGILAIDSEEGTTLMTGTARFDDFNVDPDGVSVTASGWGIAGDHAGNYVIVDPSTPIVTPQAFAGFAAAVVPTVSTPLAAVDSSQPRFSKGMILPRPVVFNGEIEIIKTYDRTADFNGDLVEHRWSISNDNHAHNFYSAIEGEDPTDPELGILHLNEEHDHIETDYTIHDDVEAAIDNFLGQQHVNGVADAHANAKPEHDKGILNYDGKLILVGSGISNYVIVNNPEIRTIIEQAPGPDLALELESRTETSITVKDATIVKDNTPAAPQMVAQPLSQMMAGLGTPFALPQFAATRLFVPELLSTDTDAGEFTILYTISRSSDPATIEPYSVNPDRWQTSRTFDNLESDTTYYIYAQSIETRNHLEGEISELLEVRTNETTPPDSASDSSQGSDSSQTSDSSQGSDSLQGSDSSQDSNSSQGSDSMSDSGSSQDSNSLPVSDSLQDSGTSAESDSLQTSDSSQTSESLQDSGEQQNSQASESTLGGKSSNSFLPNTGEALTTLSAVGLGMVGLSAMMVKLRKRRATEKKRK